MENRNLLQNIKLPVATAKLEKRAPAGQPLHSHVEDRQHNFCSEKTSHYTLSLHSNAPSNNLS